MPFGPEWMATGFEYCPVYYPDGSEFYFARFLTEENHWRIHYSTLIDGDWSPPTLAPFGGEYNESNPAFTADGSRVYWCTNRPMIGDGPGTENWNIWYAERQGDTWGPPTFLEGGVNTDSYEDYPVVTPEGNLIFTSNKPGGMGGLDIYEAILVDGEVVEVRNLGDSINTAADDFDAMYAVSNQLVFVRGDGVSSNQLFVSYRNIAGDWMEAKALGEVINSGEFQYGPKMSLDKQFFLFTRSGDEIPRTTYWVHSSVLEHYR